MADHMNDSDSSGGRRPLTPTEEPLAAPSDIKLNFPAPSSLGLTRADREARQRDLKAEQATWKKGQANG